MHESIIFKIKYVPMFNIPISDSHVGGHRVGT